MFIFEMQVALKMSMLSLSIIFYSLTLIRVVCVFQFVWVISWYRYKFLPGNYL